MYHLLMTIPGPPTVQGALATAVEVAFTSLGYPVDRVVRVATQRFATGKTSLRNWARWRAKTLDQLAEDGRVESTVSIPETPTEAVEAIAPVCAECLEKLGYTAIPGDDVPIAEAWKVAELHRVEAEAGFRMVDRDGNRPRLDNGVVRVDSGVVNPEILFVTGGANDLKWLETQKVLAEWSTLIIPHP